MTSIHAHNGLASPPRIGRSRAIGRLGTTARVLTGIALFAAGIVYAAGPSAWWQLSLGLVGLPAAVTAAQLARLSYTKRALNQTDHAALCINCAVLAALLMASATRNATLVFLGASLLLAAVRGYGGCESLAISNWLLRRDDQVGCLLFSSLDQGDRRRDRPPSPGGPAAPDPLSCVWRCRTPPGPREELSSPPMLGCRS